MGHPALPTFQAVKDIPAATENISVSVESWYDAPSLMRGYTVQASIKRKDGGSGAARSCHLPDDMPLGEVYPIIELLASFAVRALGGRIVK